MKKYLSLVLAIILAVSLVPNMVLAANIGDVIGYAQPTDIVATISGYQLESYNVEGLTYICVEDLRYYGFDVYYDDTTRSLYVSRNNEAVVIDPQNTNPNFWAIGSSNTKKPILYTDIVTYINGAVVPSCNINGQTIIQFDNLNVFGTVTYIDEIREILLLIEDMEYNDVALFALLCQEKSEYNEDWKIIFRAKGDLLMLIGTAHHYMSYEEREYYLNNFFVSDKQSADEILAGCIENEIPVSSVYMEVRNSDGTLLASYQTN